MKALVSVLAVVAAVSAGCAMHFYAELHASPTVPIVEQHLNDSTEALLATTTRERDHYRSLVAAANQLGGKPIAGIEIHVAPRDTTLKHDSLPTRITDSLRTAQFRDSTFAGVIEGTMSAPPFPAALGLSYQVHRPAFDPKVGFVQVGDKAVAVVTWQGEKTTIDAPFFTPSLTKPKRLERYVGWSEVQALGIAGPIGKAEGGFLLNLLGLQLNADVQLPMTPVPTRPEVSVGIRKIW
jgi:hypothetical protein